LLNLFNFLKELLDKERVNMKRSATPSCTDRVRLYKDMLTLLGTLLLAICAGLVEERRLLGPLEDPQAGSRLLEQKAS
jgi:hypothetical protein